MPFFEQIKQLYENGLYDNLVQLLNLTMPQLENSSEVCSPLNEFQLLVYYGDALYHTKQYKKAEIIYQKLLLLRKNVSRNRRRSQVNGTSDVLTEVDIRYKLHLCYKKMEQYSNAVMALEQIQHKQRTAKINLAMGEMYKLEKNPMHAASCLKEVVREHPFSLSTIVDLIKLEVKVSEILSLVSPAINNSSQMSWLNNWIRSQHYIYSSTPAQAIPILKQITERSQLKDNIELLISLGEAYYYNGEYKNAIDYFKKAYTREALTLRGIDIYASCLAKENQLKELESLSNKMIQYCEASQSIKSFEPWLVLAYYCFFTCKRESKAYYFVQKACLLNSNSIEALLLKGAISIEAKSYAEAINCFQEAFIKAPYRFEPMKCLVDIYLIEKRKSNALTTATTALKTLSTTPRTLTLYATALLFEASASDKKNARLALEKALKLSPTHLDAVFKLASIFIDEKNYDKAIEILNKALEGGEENSKVHKLLSECYNEKSEHDKALHHRTIATRLEATFRNANDLSQRLEHHITTNGIEPTLELEVDDIPPSDEEIDESETEVVWSDDN